MSSVIPQRSDNAGPRPQLVISVDDGIAETLAYLPDGRRVVTGSDDGTVKVWNLERGDQEGTSMKCKRDVFGLAVTRDGTRIISGDEDGSIKVWDVEFHELIREWTHEGGCFDISISPDDRLIAVADKTVIVYTVEGRLVNDAIEVDHDGTVLSVSFSPDGNKLACGTSGSDIRVYDVKSGKPILRPLKGHKGRVYRVLWSRDGSKIFSASHDKTIRCWNSDTGEQIEQPWSGHKEIISSLSLSPDGSILASASKDKTVRFWDANSGHPIGQQLEHGDRVSAVSFSSSGGFVVSTTWAGKLYLWRVPWLDSVESQTSQGTNLDMVHNTVHCAQLSLFPPVRDQNSTETDALRMSAMVPPDSDTMQYIFPYPYPTHHLELLQVRRTVPDFPFVPGADQLSSSARRTGIVAPSTIPHLISASHLAVELQYESSTLRENFPAPSDLTPYISKADDHYVAGGGFGDVYRCWYIGGSAPNEVAVKAFRFTFAIDGDATDGPDKMLRRELGIWRRLDHKNVVPFLGIAYGFGMRGVMSLVSLWMPNESLHLFLAKHDDDLGLGHRLQFLLDTADGLHYLHSFPIVHGDLNCNNVLLDADYTVRLADFGYASLIGAIPEALTYLQRSTARPGALRWVAPEQIKSPETFNRTPKSDIYSFGCIALQVLTGKQPWSEVREDAYVVLCLVQGHKPGRPDSRMIDDAHWNLIQDCWSSIEERPAAKLIISAMQRFLSYCPSFSPLSDLTMSSSSQADISTKNVTHAMRDESDQNRNVGSISGASGSDRPRKSKKRRTSPADKQSSRVTTTEAYVHKKRRV